MIATSQDANKRIVLNSCLEMGEFDDLTDRDSILIAIGKLTMILALRKNDYLTFGETPTDTAFDNTAKAMRERLKAKLPPV